MWDIVSVYPEAIVSVYPTATFWEKVYFLSIQGNLQLASITWIYKLVVHQHVWYKMFSLHQFALTQQLIMLTARNFTFTCKKHIFVKKTCFLQHYQVSLFMTSGKFKGLENIMVTWPQMCSIAKINGASQFTRCLSLPRSPLPHICVLCFLVDTCYMYRIQYMLMLLLFALSLYSTLVNSGCFKCALLIKFHLIWFDLIWFDLIWPQSRRHWMVRVLTCFAGKLSNLVKWFLLKRSGVWSSISSK